jgi:hypothetical protein
MDERFIKRLGLSGDEGKNFVPVDWVASAIAYIVTHPQLHGRTYHLASPKPVSVRLLQSVVKESIRRFCKRRNNVKVSSQELDIYEKLFHDQLLIYRSHWRDDPVFDLTNTQQALGHMPCPDMDFDLLLRVARWAVENNFTVAKHAPASRPIDARRLLDPWLKKGTGSEQSEAPVPFFATGYERSEAPVPFFNARSQTNMDSAEPVDFQVSGCGGGQWRLLVRDADLVGAELGLSGDNNRGYYLNTDSLAALAQRRCTVEQAVGAGRLVIEGPRDLQPRLIGILKSFISADTAANTRI